MTAIVYVYVSVLKRRDDLAVDLLLLNITVCYIYTKVVFWQKIILLNWINS